MKREISATPPSSDVRFSLGSGSGAWRGAADKNAVPLRDAGETVPPLSNRFIREKVEEINQKLIGDHKRIEYSFHERPSACVMTIIDTDTGEVVKQIPAEALLDMASAIWDRFGILVNEEG